MDVGVFPCGTEAAYKRHHRAGENACSACKAAQAAAKSRRKHNAVWAAKHGDSGTERMVDPCGTVGAAARHYRHGETLCDECRVAWRADAARRYALRAAKSG